MDPVDEEVREEQESVGSVSMHLSSQSFCHIRWDTANKPCIAVSIEAIIELAVTVYMAHKPRQSERYHSRECLHAAHNFLPDLILEEFGVVHDVVIK